MGHKNSGEEVRFLQRRGMSENFSMFTRLVFVKGILPLSCTPKRSKRDVSASSFANNASAGLFASPLGVPSNTTTGVAVSAGECIGTLALAHPCLWAPPKAVVCESGVYIYIQISSKVVLISMLVLSLSCVQVVSTVGHRR